MINELTYKDWPNKPGRYQVRFINERNSPKYIQSIYGADVRENCGLEAHIHGYSSGFESVYACAGFLSLEWAYIGETED